MSEFSNITYTGRIYTPAVDLRVIKDGLRDIFGPHVVVNCTPQETVAEVRAEVAKMDEDARHFQRLASLRDRDKESRMDWKAIRIVGVLMFLIIAADHAGRIAGWWG